MFFLENPVIAGISFCVLCGCFGNSCIPARRDEMADLKTQTPAEVLDVLGRALPYPLVLTKKQIEQMAPGQVLKVLCDAPASAEDSIPR